MGVNGLWSLLKDIKKNIHLSKCRGTKLAVDLSSWLVSCAQVNTGSNVGQDFLRCRSVFFRILNLLSLGITPVFVVDSKDAPASKKRQRGVSFYHLAEEYQVLLKALGVPVIQSPGEAEKTCAELNRREEVDGCLTNDGDALVYGAKTVYKGFFSDRQDVITEKYEMSDVENQLSLKRNDLIAFALLSGSDICDGIHGIGEAKFSELACELHRNGVTDILQRIQSWRTDDQLKQLEEKSEELKTLAKGGHCSRCYHEGTIQRHKKQGCQVCSTQENCVDFNSQAPDVRCPCARHILEATVKPFQVELKIRNSAIKIRDFPSPTVIAEYLQGQVRDDTKLELNCKLPDFHKVFDIICPKLNLTRIQILSHLIPPLIRLHLHGCLTEINPQPSEIVKTKVIQKEMYFVVKWKMLPELQDYYVDESCYECDIFQDLFKSKFGEMAKVFMEKQSAEKLSAKKRKQTNKPAKDDKQPKITDMFQVRKKITSKDVPPKS